MPEKVRVDADLKELVPGYLDNVRKYCVDISESLNKKDFDAVQRVGHNLKGSGGGYGFEEISKLGAAIENYARAQDAAATQSELGKLQSYMSTVEVIYV